MRSAVFARALLPCGLLALVGCTDFPTPAQLEKPTILAVTADPPVVAPGASARLETIVASRTGVVTGLATRYRLIETYVGVAPIGRLEQDASGVRYVAPDPVPTLPGGAVPADSIEVQVDSPDEPITALKVMPVADLMTANPRVGTLAIGDRDGLTGPITVHRGETLALDVKTDPPASDDARYAWYTAAGTIEHYQSNPAEMVVDDKAESGWLFVVVRDGRGGIAWRGVEVAVE